MGMRSRQPIFAIPAHPLKIQTSPKLNLQLQTYPTSERQEIMETPNTPLRLALQRQSSEPTGSLSRESPVEQPTPREQIKVESSAQRATSQTQELDMQYEQTNRNINYLRSFLLAQRLNTL